MPPFKAVSIPTLLILAAACCGCRGATLADQMDRPTVGQNRDIDTSAELPRPVLAPVPDPSTVDGSSTDANGPGAPGATVGTPRPQPASAKEAEALVAPIPMPTRTTEILIDEDSIVAMVNGKVISAKDLRREVQGDRQRQYQIYKQMAILPWQREQAKRVDESERQELAQHYNRLVTTQVFRLEAEFLRSRLGSIPKEQVDQAIQEARKRHGAEGNSPAANQRWLELLRQNNLTFFDFQRQVRDQLEASRVTQFYAFAPDQRLGLSFDVSPGDMMAEYLRSPIVATRNIEIFDVRFPMLVESAEEKARQERRAEDFLSELRRKFDEVQRRERLGPAEMIAKKGQVFLQLARAYFPNTPSAPRHLPSLDDEESDVAEEIRRTEPGDISAPIVGDKAITVVFVLKKEQSGFEAYTSASVQRELEQRLVAQRWTAFRNQVVLYLKSKATVKSWEEGVRR